MNRKEWMIPDQAARYLNCTSTKVDDFATGNTEIVLLEIGALDSRRLLFLRAAHLTLRGL
jgi:hypothetical protein